MKKRLKKKNSRHPKLVGGATATKARILEVGDLSAVRAYIGETCKRRGFEVIQAHCGGEALDLYRRCGPFVLVLSDLYWYDEGGSEPPISNIKAIRHGIQLASAIRKLAPKQNIVIRTGASLLREQMPKELSDVRILKKPLRIKELESLL